MEIAVISCVWQRPKLDQVFLMQVERLHSYGIDTIIIGSQKETYALQHENEPLHEKWNYALSLTRNYDYVIILGSDDFIPDSTIHAYKYEMQNNTDFIYVNDYHFFDGELHYWPGYENERKGEPTGTMRCLSKKLLSALDYKLFGGNTLLLDSFAYKKINTVFHTKKALTGSFGVGIKAEFNLVDVVRIKNLEKADIAKMYSIPEWGKIKELF